MTKKSLIRVLVVVGAGVGAGALLVAPALGAKHDPLNVGSVPAANARLGVADNILGDGLSETSAAWGALKLSNPDTAAGITHYGYNTSNGGPLTQDQHEAFKTEPDKNAYLVFGGKHYLFQGHEGGPRGYVTRVNLDETDPAKRVTLIADTDANGGALPDFDGITWDPFTHQLLLTAESAAPTGGVFAVALDGNGNPVDGKVHRLDGLGSGSYEGVQNDSAGDVWLVEDLGGASVSGGKKPNSYVYRFKPTDKTDLTKGGTLQALQLLRKNGTPLTASQLSADPASPDIVALHTYGKSFATRWVSVHSGTGTYDATASAASAGATPFKRPENGVFRPGTGFGQFFFTETGDTSATSTLPGAFGAVFRVEQSSPNSSSGRLSPAFVGDVKHTGLDNLSFASRDKLLVVEDAGDGLHAQRNALDSGYLIDVDGHRGHRGPDPVRWLAEGRDASATYDAITSPGYNDGDNEITGIHVSDGDPSTNGILGAKLPTPFTKGWRVFWTQQHGDNVTWEVHPSR